MGFLNQGTKTSWDNWFLFSLLGFYNIYLCCKECILISHEVAFLRRHYKYKYMSYNNNDSSFLLILTLHFRFHHVLCRGVLTPQETHRTRS